MFKPSALFIRKDTKSNVKKGNALHRRKEMFSILDLAKVQMLSVYTSLDGRNPFSNHRVRATYG
jgi:hypothetical protein